MKNKTLKKKLKKNEITIGSWITIGHPAIAEILSNAGFDWLTVDIEHNSIDNLMVQNLISTIQSKNIAALVRVSKNEEVVIKHVLDAGADGIIVPMINTAEEAQKAVEYAKYPPIGKRGVGLSRAQNYGLGFNDYKEWVKNDLVIIAQIEHIEGVKNIQKIISTKGIDGIIIGPYDLSGSLGYPGEYERDEVKEALNKVKQICLKANFPLGYHVVPPDIELLKSKIIEGYKFLAFSTDFYFMGDTAKKLMYLIK
ncbi:MAG TPA: aldolase/citrate lyase family protein [Bacteroidales bacterium]|nr:aldolase/citrate lyase family protein [Bacteroidales bacterium]